MPELKPYLSTGEDERLAHGSRQRLRYVMYSLTTTSAVIAALNSIVAGALASDVSALLGAFASIDVAAGVIASLASGSLHALYAARYRRRHAPPRAA